MKKLFYLLLSITILISCDSDKEIPMNSKTMKMTSFVNAPIGKSIDG